MSIDHELSWQLCTDHLLLPLLRMSTSYENSFEMYKCSLMELMKSISVLDKSLQSQATPFDTSFKTALFDIVHAIEAHAGDVRKRKCDLDITGSTLTKLGELSLEIRSKLGGAGFTADLLNDDLARKVALFGFCEVMQVTESAVDEHSLFALILPFAECAAVALKAEEAAFRYRAFVVSDRFCNVLGISDGQIWKTSNSLEAVHTAYRKNRIQGIFKVDALIPVDFDEYVQSALERVKTGNLRGDVPDVKPGFKERLAQAVKSNQIADAKSAENIHRVVCDLKLVLLKVQSILVSFVEESTVVEVSHSRPTIEADCSNVSKHRNSSGLCRCM